MYLYFAADLRSAGLFDHGMLAQTTERHNMAFALPPLQSVPDASAVVSGSAATGVVFEGVVFEGVVLEGVVLELGAGLPSAPQLRLIDVALRGGKRSWIYWPTEQAIECVDDERLQSLRRHVTVVNWLKRLVGPVDRAVTRWHRFPTALRWVYRGEFPVRRSDIFIKLNQLSLRAQPVPLDPPVRRNPGVPFPGIGLYLRADYWTRPEGDEHASRIVRELATVSERVVCLTPRADPLLDEAGVQQV